MAAADFASFGWITRMTIEWTQTKARYEYYYGRTGTRFSAQIGQSTNAGKYAWMIFHDDFCYCVFGGEADSLDDAKRQSSDWLNANAKPHTKNAESGPRD